MNTKRISVLILSTLLIIIIGLLIANWLIGKSIARDIDESLQQMITSGKIPESISYQEIHASPLFSSMKIKGLKIDEKYNDFNVNIDEVQINFSSKQILKWLKGTEDFNELHSFTIVCSDPNLNFNNEMQINSEKIKLEFDGSLHKDVFIMNSDSLLNSKLQLKFNIDELKIARPSIFEEMYLDEELQRKASRIDNISLEIKYDPKSHKVVINNLQLSSPIYDFKLTGDCLLPDSLSKITGNIVVNNNLSFTMAPGGISWQGNDETGKFELEKLSISTKGKLTSVFDYRGRFKKLLPENEFSVNLEGLKYHLPDEILRDMKKSDVLEIFTRDDLRIEIIEFSANYQLKHNRLIVKDAALTTPAFKVFLNGRFYLPDEEDNDVTIRRAQIEIESRSKKWGEKIKQLEEKNNQYLPREDGNIVLEIRGTLDKPKIKGIDF
ncbi:MAG: hypothetical protein ACW99F_14525 [Candidatus Hodarchaeales archaeon]|jgi:hypothetical protein